MKIKFLLDRETKGAVRFAEHTGEDALAEAIIGTLYVRKSGLRRLGYVGIPPYIHVEIEGPGTGAEK